LARGLMAPGQSADSSKNSLLGGCPETTFAGKPRKRKCGALIFLTVGCHSSKNIRTVGGLSEQNVKVNKIDRGTLAFIDTTFQLPQFFNQEGCLV